MLAKNSLASYISAKTGYEKCGNKRMVNNKPLIREVTKSETEEYQIIRTTFLRKRMWLFLSKA